MNKKADQTDNPETIIDDVGTRPRPVDDEMRADIYRLHAMRMGRNEIARELRIAGSTVTKVCQAHEPPLEFNRDETALAVRARQIDLADSRTKLAAMFLVRGIEALEAMDVPMTIGQFGGKDNTWNERLIDEPTLEGRRNLMTTAAIAAQRHLELVRVDSNRDLSASEGLIDSLGVGIAAFAAAYMAANPDTNPEVSDTLGEPTP